LAAAILIAMFAAVFVLSTDKGKLSGRPSQRTTEATVAASGARVLLSDPELKVEPK
jgi:hypothetical protein